MSAFKTSLMLVLFLLCPQSFAGPVDFYSNGDISVFVDSDSELRATIYWPGSEPGSSLGRAHFVLEDRIFDGSKTRILINEMVRIHHDTAYPQRSFLYLGGFDRRSFEVHFWQGKGGDAPGMSLVFKEPVAAESIGFRAGRDYSGFTHKRGPRQISEVQFCSKILR